MTILKQILISITILFFTPCVAQEVLEKTDISHTKIKRIYSAGRALYRQLEHALLMQRKALANQPIESLLNCNTDHADLSTSLVPVNMLDDQINSVTNNKTIKNIIISYFPVISPMTFRNLNNLYDLIPPVLNQQMLDTIDLYMTNVQLLVTKMLETYKTQFDSYRELYRASGGVPWPHSPELQKKFESHGFQLSPTLLEHDQMICNTCGVTISGLTESDCPEYYHQLDCSRTPRAGTYVQDITQDQRVPIFQLLRYAYELNLLQPLEVDYYRQLPMLSCMGLSPDLIKIIIEYYSDNVTGHRLCYFLLHYAQMPRWVEFSQFIEFNKTAAILAFSLATQAQANN